MNITELAALIQIRNHLNLLTEARHVIGKNDVRAAQNRVIELDKKIAAEAMKLNLDNHGMDERVLVSEAAAPTQKQETKTAMVDKAVVVVPVEPEVERSADLPPARPIKLGGGKKSRTTKSAVEGESK